MRSNPVFVLACTALLVGLVQPANAQAPASSPPATAPSTEAPASPPPAATPAPAPSPAAAAPAASPAPAAPAGPVYIVTYFEVAPNAARRAAALLRQFAAETRKADGNTELTVLHEIGRPGRFAIVEAWRDNAAHDAHSAAMKALGDKLQPIFAAPFDARTFLPMAVAAPGAGGDLSNAVFVLTHVDVFPAGKDEVAAMIKQLADDSRKDGGSQRFDAVIQDEHPNHFHLIEAWSDRKSLEAHALVEHTKAFRAKLVPFEGALYDERIYEAVKKTE
jgi:quinol monooxygenase YgiN